MATDIGKVFEAELEKSLKDLNKRYLLAWHRFPDTHSAGGGNIIQPQPSDYLLGLPLGARVPSKQRGINPQRGVFFEAKATEKYKTLQKAAVRPEQRGFIHFYAGMLQLPYLICHYSAVTGDMQIWDGTAIIEDRIDRKKYLLAEFPAGDGRKLHKETVIAEFVQFFDLPDRLKTVKLYKQLCGDTA